MKCMYLSTIWQAALEFHTVNMSHSLAVSSDGGSNQGMTAGSRCIVWSVGGVQY
jgi:hypothetical protein